MVEFEIHFDSIEGNNEEIKRIINELKTTTNSLVKG
jgi:hypothetical protein